MKVLYQVFIYENTNLSYDVDELIKEQLDMENSYVFSMVHGILDKKEDLYRLANEYLVDWSLDRFNKVDQVILCIGIYELLYTETPAIVAINEAVELSHKYSEEKVVKLINGVLDHIYHSEDYHE